MTFADEQAQRSDAQLVESFPPRYIHIDLDGPYGSPNGEDFHA